MQAEFTFASQVFPKNSFSFRRMCLIPVQKQRGLTDLQINISQPLKPLRPITGFN